MADPGSMPWPSKLLMVETGMREGPQAAERSHVRVTVAPCCRQMGPSALRGFEEGAEGRAGLVAGAGPIGCRTLCKRVSG